MAEGNKISMGDYVEDPDSGIHKISMRSYVEDPCSPYSVSSGHLKTVLSKSAGHAYFEHPRLGGGSRLDSTKAKEHGTLSHALLLDDEGVVQVSHDFDSYRSKAARQWRDEVHAAGKIPFLGKEIAPFYTMKEEAESYLRSVTDFDKCLKEQTLIWKEEVDGEEFWCRARPDLLDPENQVIFDYKTTTDASQGHFLGEIVRLRYDISGTHYLRGVKKVLGWESPRFILLAQEKVQPYACGMFELFDESDESDSKYWLAWDLWSSLIKEKRLTGRVSYYPTTPVLVRRQS